jgi:predicted nucleotidyltransferase/DNA-binding transcriptional ArsR family regulator
VDLAFPYRPLAEESALEALRVLARTSRPLTGRDVARLARGRSHSAIQRALNRLEESGVVTGQEAGRAILYVLNRDHVAAGAALALLDLRGELLRRIAGALGAWRLAPDHVSVYGSTARGDGDEASDVDLFIVRPGGVDEESGPWREQIAQLEHDVRAWSGNVASVSEIGPVELRRLRRERPTIVSELETDAVTLYGPSIDELFRDRR